jgi:hypothetical protein
VNSTDSKFSLFEQEDKDLYDLMKSGIVGGPSIIFKRYVEAGKTLIRNGSKLCKKAIEYDANAFSVNITFYVFGIEGPFNFSTILRRSR